MTDFERNNTTDDAETHDSERNSGITVLEPYTAEEATERASPKRKPKHQPRYNVVLWNDEYHTYEYVIRMLMELFGYSLEQGFRSAKIVDTEGQCVLLTTTQKHAELKRDQIHAYGRDPGLRASKGSMWATIESAPGE
jgi:Uncharacterized conserved protein